MIVTLVASAFVAPIHDVQVTSLLDAIRQVEGHPWTDPGGAYAIQPSTWRQHTKLPYRLASVATHATAVAERHLAWLARSLAADGFPVTPYTLAGCWRFGFEGFKRRRGQPIDYATRVTNLYAWHQSLR